MGLYSHLSDSFIHQFIYLFISFSMIVKVIYFSILFSWLLYPVSDVVYYDT